jgi:hypothetical protein
VIQTENQNHEKERTMSSGILMNDLARMARNGEGQLIGRPITDANVLEEVAFRDKHGMSRADMAARDALWKRSDAEDAILEDYRGAIPGDVIGEFRGLKGARLEFARFGAWRDRTAAQLTELEATKANLTDIIAQPGQTQNSIVAAVKRTARLLLGAGTEDDADARLELDRKLAAEQHRAEAAAQVLPEVEAQIAAKKKQYHTLIDRTVEFLNPAMIEIFEESGIGKIYAGKKAEMQALDNLVSGFLRGYTDRNTPDVTSLAPAPRIDLGWAHSWHEIENELRKDARAEVGKLLPKLAKAA